MNRLTNLIFTKAEEISKKIDEVDIRRGRQQGIRLLQLSSDMFSKKNLQTIARNRDSEINEYSTIEDQVYVICDNFDLKNALGKLKQTYEMLDHLWSNPSLTDQDRIDLKFISSQSFDTVIIYEFLRKTARAYFECLNGKLSDRPDKEMLERFMDQVHDFIEVADYLSQHISKKFVDAWKN